MNNSSGLDFSGFLLEHNTDDIALKDTEYHGINLCDDTVVRHAPLILCSHKFTTGNNKRNYERIFPNVSRKICIDFRPEHTNLASDAYLQNKK